MSDSREVSHDAAPTFVRVEERPGEFTVYGHKNVDLVIWHASPTAEGVRCMQHLVQRRVGETGKKMSSVHVSHHRGGLPGAEARREFAAMAKKGAASLGCFVFLFEAEGFRASAFRGFVTGLLSLGSVRYTCHIAKSMDEAVRWLVEPHARATGVLLDPRELREAFQAARARHPRTSSAPQYSLSKSSA